jgi:hypothetical protein
MHKKLRQIKVRMRIFTSNFERPESKNPSGTLTHFRFESRKPAGSALMVSVILKAAKLNANFESGGMTAFFWKKRSW